MIGKMPGNRNIESGLDRAKMCSADPVIRILLEEFTTLLNTLAILSHILSGYLQPRLQLQISGLRCSHASENADP